jgi:glyoxylase-like metal-dependent hydrolase (beta-lactamase superfamily II)
VSEAGRIAGIFQQLGLQVLERGWLSSNNVFFSGHGETGPAVVDTGYDTHSDQTQLLLAALPGAAGIERVLNTHLHSDHCGGNAALQQRWGCEVWVPEASFDAARDWDADRLSFDATDQRCLRFSVHAALGHAQTVDLGAAPWQVIAAPGHDAEAVMFFQPESRVLISADALWEDRLAIIFPELDGEPGFGPAREALNCIEALRPSIVIPGHGRPFTDVASALIKSRQRLDQFEQSPDKHWRYAMRALVMFQMLERQQRGFAELVDWMLAAPVFQRAHQELVGHGGDPRTAAADTITRLQTDGILFARGGIVSIRP